MKNACSFPLDGHEFHGVFSSFSMPFFIRCSLDGVRSFLVPILRGDMIFGLHYDSGVKQPGVQLNAIRGHQGMRS